MTCPIGDDGGLEVILADIGQDPEDDANSA